MATFELRVLGPDGRLQSRRLSASDADTARRQIEAEGLQVIQLRRQDMLGRIGRSGRFDLVLFAHELRALLQAGLSLIEALEALAERQQAASADATVLQALVGSLYEGQAFSKAIARFPDAFPELFVATMAASEQTGDLVEALERYLRHHEQVSVVRNKIASAALYPLLLLLVGTGVGVFLLCFLVPRFSHVYDGLATELPLASRLLMQWGMFASQHSLAVVLTLAGLLVLAVYAVLQPSVQGRLLAMLQRNRWLGEKLWLMQLSRFYRALGLLLRGGIPMVKGLRMTTNLLPLAAQPRLLQAVREVTEGKPLSVSLERAQLTTPVSLRLIRAGERNGQVAEMLERVASFHDAEVSRWIDRFTRLFEPVLMLVIGGVIGGIVILLYLPIFELAGSLQ
ncbi:MAG: type II secretion system F family protein [Moraxellaceae bacterium]|nr:type II secretion system F family protein [Moraxellaceae bacterium]